MKQLQKLFKINLWTYLLFFLFCLCGFFKQGLIIFLIVFIHEMGHVCILKRYQYPIMKVELYPFGGVTTVDKPINTPLRHEFFIAIFGVVFQLLLWGVFFLLEHFGYIYIQTYEMFCYYNFLIMGFNLLPLIPLDGSVILHTILEKIFPYTKAYRFFCQFCMLFLGVFIFVHFKWNLNQYLMIVLLIYKTYMIIKNRHYTRHRFLLERYLYEYPYHEIKSHDMIDIDEMRKGTLHFFKKNEKYKHEREILSELFQKK